MAANKSQHVGVDGIVRPLSEEEQLNKTFSSVFSTESGAHILRYLRSITIERVNGPGVTDAELRHAEGQRYIVGLIETRNRKGHS